MAEDNRASVGNDTVYDPIIRVLFKGESWNLCFIEINN